MQPSTQKAFDELFKDHENNFCFECGSPSNHWASVNNGIFLCLNCSGLHRGFGVNISFVRSVNMDSWSDLQLAMMRNGGNAKLRAFFEEYSMPKDGPIDFKYRTKAAAYYREMLKALAEGKPVPNPPGADEGRELLSNKNPNFNPSNITGFGSAPPKEESALDKVVSFMNTAVDKTVNVTKETAQKVADPTFQEGVKQGVVSFGTSVATGTKDVAGKVADKSKEIWTNRDEYIQKGSESVKQGWSATVGFFKKLGGGGNTDPSNTASDTNTEQTKAEGPGKDQTQL